MLKRVDGKGILRVFDPLQYPGSGFERQPVSFGPTCVLNLTTFLEQGALRRVKSGEKRSTNNDREFYHLKKDLEIFDKLNPSEKEHFSMELLVTVNGHLMDDRSIDYLKSIDDTMICNDRIHIVVHQRPNVGWQWGSLWDIWQRWKTLETAWWMTKEIDWHFKVENWFDVLREMFRESENAGNRVGFISGHERKFVFDPYFYDGPLSENVWRDSLNKPLKKATMKDVRHVQPSYYFIRRDLLQDMDSTYGCFTYALGSNYELDAIVYGEMGFSQKANALGYTWVEFDDLCYNEDF